MRVSPWRLRTAGGLILAAGVLWLAADPASAPSISAATPAVVYSAEIDSIIQPVAAEYMIATIDRADQERAALVVFTLRTPGGLVDSTRSIVSRMITATTPIVVFVAPAGARAASAGFILTIAADVAAMAPGTHIGAASPVSGGGEKLDDVAERKATADLAAYARTLATRRHRNVQLAEEAVSKSRAFTDGEAVSASPPLVDIVASDLQELLRKIDGRTVTRFDGSTVVIKVSQPSIVAVQMNWRQRLLSAIAHPNIAYLLMSLGMLGLTIELWSPGAVLPGVVGGLSLLLAFFAFQVLPVNYAGLLLILFGLLLLVLEIKVTSFGLLTAGGLISLFLGSTMLIDSGAPELKISLRLIIPVTVGLAGILLFLVRLGIAAQRGRPVTGDAGMLNEIGRALTAIEAGSSGQVEAHGEIWQAVSVAPVSKGQNVRVLAVKGLTLTVQPVSEE